MADRGDTHYHVPSLNFWFLISSAAFLLTMVWTVVDDWNAEWKRYQREFRRIDLAITEEVVADLFFTSEGRRAPYPRYARLRELAPVHYSTALQAWFATRYADWQS